MQRCWALSEQRGQPHEEAGAGGSRLKGFGAGCYPSPAQSIPCAAFSPRHLGKGQQASLHAMPPLHPSKEEQGGEIWVAASKDVLVLTERAAPSRGAGTHGASPSKEPGHLLLPRRACPQDG